MAEIPHGAVRAVAEILRFWEVDESGEPVDPVEEFDNDARELLQAAGPLIAEQARAQGAADERARIVADLKRAAEGRRAYTNGLPEGHRARAELLEEAAGFESAARVAEDPGTLVEVLPLCMWNAEEGGDDAIS